MIKKFKDLIERIKLVPKKKLKDLEERFNKVLQDFQELSIDFREKGGHAAEEVVIPEYLGFKNDKENSSDEIRAFRRDEEEYTFVIYRPDPRDSYIWTFHVIHEGEEVGCVNGSISDQQQMILFLNALGSDLTLKRYADHEDL
jgi:hypothetical protein